ncbi:TetR/AcrR family transcriptional regulator [Paenibacillus beijingensis]|uniref:TetR family transcriptional regulator n=1 Tax=Paenibacillus beijingensis TaxID=1126833 RepID=A0A0D5NEL7_9BACL|nr:TetR family transcriptional regulator [Paenibacillus beijingensis]
MARAGLDLLTVLMAAAELADTKGVEELSLATLAQKLGIRSPSLYNHVEGLPGLRNKLVTYGLSQMRDSMTRAAIGKSGDDAVKAIAEAYIEFVRRHPGLYEVTHRFLESNDENHRRAAGEVVEIIIRVLDAYDLDKDTAIHIIRGLRSLLHGFASIEQQGGFNMPLDLNESFRVLIDTFLAGIRSINGQKSMR